MPPPLNMPVSRETIPQTFDFFTATVTTTPQNLSDLAGGGGGSTLDRFYVSLILSVPTNQAQSAFVGPETIDGTAGAEVGIEIPVGVPINLKVEQVRQLYEVQDPLWKRWISLLCQDEAPYGVPFKAFDLQQYWVVAAANTVLNVMLFPEPFV